jgi:hypothetical protein
MHRAQSPAGTGSPVDAASSLVLTRRDLFTLVGSAAVLVACGGTSHARSSITASGGGATASGAASSRNVGISTPPVTGGGNGSTSGTLVHVGGPHATGADAMSVAGAQEKAQVADGHWQGGWHDATGASGDSDVVIAVNAESRTATASVSFGGALFGAALPSVTYDIDLLSFKLSDESYSVSSPQFGQVTIVPGGHMEASGTARVIPGEPTIDHVDVDGSMVGRRVDVTYTVHYADGHSVKGTAAWTATGERAVPQPLGSAGSPTTSEIATGAYAAGLLDAKGLMSALGEAFNAPTSNGGNLLYDNGVAASNAVANATSGDYSVEYTVYVGASAADTDAFWKKQNPGLPTTPGPWQSGFYYPEVQAFYAELPTRVVLVKVSQLKATAAPTTQQSAMIQQWEVQVATALVNSLKSG